MPTNSDADTEVVFEYTGEECVVPKYVTIVRFHPSVVEVENEAFRECNILREVVLKEGLRTIGENAFRSCTSLSNIIMPSTVTEIDICAFRGCPNLREVVLNDGLRKIGWWAFQECASLSSITIPFTVTEIGYAAFDSCIMAYLGRLG